MVFNYYVNITSTLAKYLYNKLQPILKEIEYGNFLEAFNEVVEPSWVSEYRRVK